jgi:hypothetical protein
MKTVQISYRNVRKLLISVGLVTVFLLGGRHARNAIGLYRVHPVARALGALCIFSRR